MRHLLSLLGLVSVFIACIAAELIDSDDVERFCYPEEHKNSRKSCECINVSEPPWGMRAVTIDCSYKYFKSQDFSSEVLPLYVDTLDISWNSLEQLPIFASDSLRLLNLMHNNISTVASKNFVKISNLRELYLSWNSIQFIELNAFADLAHLQILDLAHNNLHALYSQTFAPLLILETLNLSWNRQLNQTQHIQEANFYETLGINQKLHTLKLEACSLSNLILPEQALLVELNLRRNLLEKMPEKWPASLEKIDLSDNLFVSLLPADTAFIAKIHELLLEDMPRLQTIEENAFVPLTSLQKISFQNSRRLTRFDGHAFGINSTSTPTLRSMIFRGTSLLSINSTLAPVFRQLTELDLNGMPLHCDCEMIWVKELRLETNGRCFKPSRLRGKLLTYAPVKDFSCDRLPRWVYGLIVLGLIILSSVGIYFIVMGLRPHRGVNMRRKVGVGSPYARVTIEPNRQENNY